MWTMQRVEILKEKRKDEEIRAVRDARVRVTWRDLERVQWLRKKSCPLDQTNFAIIIILFVCMSKS